MISRPARQRGQVIPYVAFMILILTAAGLIVFDIGYLINSRIQSQNAADAAALAAVSVKINKHHVDTLVRAAMTQESIIAQAEIRAAQATALKAFFKGKTPPPVMEPGVPGQPPPGNPILGELKGLKDVYKQHANNAYKHAVKLHREGLALKAWYKWLERSGPIAVKEAARTAYALNMQGYDDIADSILRKNIEEVLAKNDDMIENGIGFGNIGGIPYVAEAARGEGVFGKSFVELQTQMVASDGGAALLKYLKQFELTSSAAAQLLRREDGKTPLSASSFLAMNWYSPYLMAIEDAPNQVGH